MGQTAPAEGADAGRSAAAAVPSRPEPGSGTTVSVFPSSSERRVESTAPFSLITDRRTGETTSDGLFCGNVYGTYVHGVFDAPGIARRTVQALAAEKGLSVGTDTGAAEEGTDREERVKNNADALLFTHEVCDGAAQTPVAALESSPSRNSPRVPPPTLRNEREDMDLPDKYKEAQYDALAATLREHLDLEKIYRILEEGVS